MLYTKIYLEDLRKRITNENTRNLEELGGVIVALRKQIELGKKLTLAEEEFICGLEKFSIHSNFNSKIDVEKNPACFNYWFKNKFLVYERAKDLNGLGIVRDVRYEINGSVISKEEKQRDVKMFNDVYILTLKDINSDEPTKDEIYNYLLSELRFQYKKLKYFVKKSNIDSLKLEYKKKQITLFGKYLFLEVKQYYQELKSNREIVKINETNILINAYCHIHILFRHFARGIIDYLPEKDVFVDPEFVWRIIPRKINELLVFYKDNMDSRHFNKRVINLKYNNIFYTIHLSPPYMQPSVGGVQNEYVKLKSFYPVGELNELNKLKSLKEVKINDLLSFLI